MFEKLYRAIYYIVTIPYMAVIVVYATLVNHLVLALTAIWPEKKLSYTSVDKLSLKKKLKKTILIFILLLLFLGIYMAFVYSGLARIVGIYFAVISSVKLWENNVRTYISKHPEILEEDTRSKTL